MKQYEAVIKVMEENGGFATLSYLYEKVLRVPGVIWKTKTPFASIRRIVQDTRFFFKIKPGLWALKTYKNRLPVEIISLIKEKENKKKDTFSHSYYQGIIVELGNMKGYKTFIPQQDKNKKYLNKPLKDIVTLNDIFRFTYDDVIEKVKFIDVFWFNERRFPVSVFEIEHSTDFKSAMLKFLELQDFNIRMHIVSPAERKREFISRLQLSAFQPIKNRTFFLSYEEVSQWHSKTYELMLMERSILESANKRI